MIASKPQLRSGRRQGLLNLSFHYLSIVLSIGQGFLLTPLLLSVVTPSLYGAWLASGNIIAWLSLADPGIAGVLQQQTAFLLGRGEHQKLGGLIRSGTWIGWALALVPAIAYPFAGALAAFAKCPPAEHVGLTTAIQLTLLATILLILSNQPEMAVIGLQAIVLSGVLSTIGTCLGIVTSILLLYSGFGLVSLPAGLLVRNGFFLLSQTVAILILRKRHGISTPSTSEIREGFRTLFSLTSVTFLGKASSTLFSQFNSVLAARMISPAAAATLGLTGRLFDAVRPIAQRIVPALAPRLALTAGQRDGLAIRKSMFSTFQIVIAITGITLGSAVAVNEGFLTAWVGNGFFGGHRLAWLLVLAAGANCATAALEDFLFASGAVRKSVYVRIAEGPLQLICQFVLLGYVGLIGIPLGSIVSSLFSLAIMLPAIIRSSLGGTANEARAQIFRALGAGALLITIGIGISMLVGRGEAHKAWSDLAVLGAFSVMTLFVVAVTINGTLRRSLVAWTAISK